MPINSCFLPFYFFTFLLFNAVDAERHGGQLVENDTLLLVGLDGNGALLWGNQFGTLDAVLVIHSRVAQRDGLGRIDTRQVLQVQADGLHLLRCVCHFDDDLAGILIEGG